MSQADLRNSAGNPYLYLEGASGAAAAGLNVGGGDLFNIVVTSAASDIDPTSGTPSISIDPSANGNITFQPNGTGESVFVTGDVNIEAGNLDMPNTTIGGAEGVINLGGNRFVHNYGARNTFIGDIASNFSLTTADATDSVAVGYSALNALTTGPYNVAVGSSSSLSITTGNQNTAVGMLSLANTTVGTDNTTIGFSCGGNLQGSSSNANVLIGTSTGINLSTNSSNNIMVGPNVTGSLSDSATIRIGNQSGGNLQSLCYIAGIAGSSNTPTGVVGVDALGKLAGSNGSNGEIQIGGGTGPVWANITSSGSTIAITNGANTINLESAITPGVTWSVVTAASQAAAVGHGYIANNAGTVVISLPSVSAVGALLEVTGINNATGWQISQATGQQIFFGASSTTSGATGTLTSSATRDSVKMVCVVANTTWNVLSAVGNLTLV